MRVISGEFKSRQLKTVKSQLTRPTTDKNKENLFNMIGPYFAGGTCLDLFAGSGGLGIEALSRGMDELYCVDKQYAAFKVIKENIASLHIEDRCHIFKSDYKKVIESFKDNKVIFDLVLLDPPYGLKINESIIKTLALQKNLNDGCIIVVEDLNEERIEVKRPFSLKKESKYGITTLQIIEYRESVNE